MVGLRSKKLSWVQIVPVACCRSSRRWQLAEWPFCHRVRNPGTRLPYYGLHVALLLGRVFGSSTNRVLARRYRLETRVWRYSLAHLLVAMTLVAVLRWYSIQSEFTRTCCWSTIAIFISGSRISGIASVVSWILRSMSLIRAGRHVRRRACFSVWRLHLPLHQFSTDSKCSLMIILAPTLSRFRHSCCRFGFAWAESLPPRRRRPAPKRS